MFRKLEKGKKVRDIYKTQIIDNTILAQPEGKTSTKPFHLYEMAEAMIPGGSYLELFGRAHNAREGWVTLGNEAITYMEKNNIEHIHHRH